jgi:hypothetical protein
MFTCAEKSNKVWINAMNTYQTISYSSAPDVNLEQPTTAGEAEQHGPSIAFFAAGMLINITLIVAYGIWAYKQWNQTRTQTKK